MELFDIINSFFNKDKKQWKSVSKNDKNRNFFMINRIMSIQYPIIANQFNKLRVEPSTVVNWWAERMGNTYTRTPKWAYTRTIKKEKADKKKGIKSEDAEDLIREKYKVSKRDLSDLKSFYPDKYDKWIKDINDQLGIK